MLTLTRISPKFYRFYCTSKPESSFWTYFSKKGVEKPAIERCKKRKVRREDPDLSRFGGEPYRTCGSAYIVQKDVIPVCDSQQTEEDRILAKIEADLSNKNNVDDPMPPFQSVEQRLIDLTERKLHPFYKRYMALPKKDFTGPDSIETSLPHYKCKSGPIQVDEIPDVFKFNKELLEKKNIFADFKRVELPKQMLVRMVEIEKNRKPTLEKKKKI